MNRKNFKKIFRGVLQEEQIFADKSALDAISKPKTIVGREEKVKEIIRNLIGYKKGFAVPLLSISGRSGSGKTAITRYVCENLEDVSFCYVNLRKSKTIFGASNLILDELGGSITSNQRGLNATVLDIENAIIKKLEKENKRTFFLVLDEIDVILSDKRGSPSDFFYKLLVIEENLKEKQYLISIIVISNNLFEYYDLDDRVKSRIGSNRVFFEPYTKKQTFKILKKIATKAFSYKIDDSILQLCSQQSSQEHGDARRAIELLRVSAELAATSDEKISEQHVKKAVDKLGSSAMGNFLSSASYHMKAMCHALALISYISGEQWHATSSIYHAYKRFLPKEKTLLTYRRISDLLNELEQAGLAASSARSQGRHGFGKQYRLSIPPEAIGLADPKQFEKWKELREKYYDLKNNPDLKYCRDPGQRFDLFEGEKEWLKLFGRL